MRQTAAVQIGKCSMSSQRAKRLVESSNIINMTNRIRALSICIDSHAHVQRPNLKHVRSHQLQVHAHDVNVHVSYSLTSRLDENEHEISFVNPLDGLPPCDNPRLIVADIHGLFTPCIKEFPPNRNGTSTVPRLYLVNAGAYVTVVYIRFEL